jgi:arylsulfatase A-like enzyme
MNWIAFLLGLVELALLAPLAAAAPPNIVVFISDDHGYLDSQVAGATDVRTPNLLRLAGAGINFTHAFAASPSCASSRAALLTGLMPNRNGSMFNHQPPRADVKKLPACMREFGYEVLAFGKVAHYEQVKDYGFDRAEHYEFHDDECIAAALEFLQERHFTGPLCLIVGTNWPHVPWPNEGEAPAEPGIEIVLPPTHIDTPETRASRAHYYAAVEKMDADLGQVYEAAYQSLGPNTVFIHFSDHGAQWPFGKWNLYDAGIRVPLFVAWPGVVEPGSKSEAMVSLVDILPTLIEIAGGQPPIDVDGRSRLGILRGESNIGRDAIFTTHSGDGRMNEYPMRSVRTSRWKYIRNLKPEAEHHSHIDRGEAVDGAAYWRSWVEKAKTDPAAQAVVDRYFHRPAEELYDLAHDPHEQRNLAGEAEFADVLSDCRTQLDRWMISQRDEGLATGNLAAEQLRKHQATTQP